MADDNDDTENNRSRSLIYFSRRACSLLTRIQLRERSAKKPKLNEEFSDYLSVGARTIACSSDFNLFACLRNSFDISVFDKRRNEIFQISGLNKSKFVGREIDVDPFNTDLEKEMSEEFLKDQF